MKLFLLYLPRAILVLQQRASEMPRNKNPMKNTKAMEKALYNEFYNYMMCGLMEGKTLREMWERRIRELDMDCSRNLKARPFEDLRIVYRQVAKDYIAMLQSQKKQQLWDEETGEMILWKH